MPEQSQPEVQWSQMGQEQRDFLRQIFVTGEMSLVALCRRYQLPYETVKRYSYNEGWTAERNKFQAMFSGDENARQQQILADVRRIVSDGLRRLCQWYSERLVESEWQNNIHEFPIDEWAVKIERFIGLIEKLSKLQGVSKEALAVSLHQHNTQVNINNGNGEDGPPGIRLDPEKMRHVIGDVLAHMTQQAKPADEQVMPAQLAQPESGAR